MDIATLISHPERLNRETLYDLRTMIALHPYYQPARLLLLQNLFLLHDPTFDEELRRAAIYITDRRKLFQLVEGIHYQLLQATTHHPSPTTHHPSPESVSVGSPDGDPSSAPSRTVTLIDSFLNSIPEDYDADEKKTKRRPTPADATIDYVAYLLDIENEAEQAQPQATPQLKGQSLIDDFIYNEGGNFELREDPEYLPDINETDNSSENDTDEGYFTETLARIYIKQGRYSKALEIIKRLNLVYPKKSRYFADQIRFLEKLIQNNNKKQIRK